MSLTRFRPVPSDRMAAIWTFLSFRDAIVLEYGPSGTTNFAKRYMQGLGLDTDHLLATDIGEDDVIMGDTARLERALVAVDKEYSPKAIFIVPSTVLAVVGSDVAGVCHYMQERVNARLIPYEGGGFAGDYSVGLNMAYTLMVSSLAKKPAEKAAATYNILGASVYSPNAVSDVDEIDSMMKTVFGASRIAALGISESVREIEEAGRAAVNLVLRAEALPAAKWLEEEFGTPYIYPAPYGYSGTLEWLSKIRKVYGFCRDNAFIEDLERTVKSLSAAESGTVSDVSVLGNYDLVAGMSSFLKNDLGITPKNLVCGHTVPATDEPCGGIIHPLREKDLLDIIDGMHGEKVIADGAAADFCRRNNEVFTFSTQQQRGRRHEGGGGSGFAIPSVGTGAADMICRFLGV